jgi:hypothetical protein
MTRTNFTASLFVAALSACRRDPPRSATTQPAPATPPPAAVAVAAGTPTEPRITDHQIVDPDPLPEWARDACGIFGGLNGTRDARVLRDNARRTAEMPESSLAIELYLMETRHRVDPDMSVGALERNAERYRCHFAIFDGEVLEIRDLPGGGAFMRLGVGRRMDPLAVFALVSPPQSIVRGARAVVSAVGGGEFTYTTTLGAELTIPRVHALLVAPARVHREPTEDDAAEDEAYQRRQRRAGQ